MIVGISILLLLVFKPTPSLSKRRRPISQSQVVPDVPKTPLCPDKPYDNNSRTTGLLVTKDELAKIAAKQEIPGDVFKIGQIEQSYEMSAMCDVSSKSSSRSKYSNSKGQRQSRETKSCDALLPLPIPPSSQRNAKGNNKCCKTKFKMILLQSVESIYTGQQLEVVHNDDAYQVVHVGRCARPNSSCLNGGKCRLAYRYQWILVKQNGVETFTPILIGNHCYCSNEF